MNTAVSYYSKTGHSKKIAGAIAKQLDISILNIQDNPNVKNLDLLFIAGGIYGGKSLPEMLRFAESLSPQKVKTVALITSCCSGKTKQTMLREILTKKGISVLEQEFVCKGGFLMVNMSHPNTQDIADTVSFAEGMIKNLLKV